MARICHRCRRANPGDAAYCYHDGALLDGRDGGPADVGARPFTLPFVLPSGRSCGNFNQLAEALQDDVESAHRLLKKGYLETFLGGQGRTDLAGAARAAARSPDRARALDDFLGALPGAPLRPAKLRVEPALIDLGTVRAGEDRRVELVLHNDGARLLHGSAVCDETPWLILGDGAGLKRKLFECSGRLVLPVRVLGEKLGARNKPQNAVIQIESSGGAAAVAVRLVAPVRPFPEGMLSGAVSPRQLAEKAREAPKEAGALIESGAVARWYRDNGWVYPVSGPTATGTAAVQQLFEALGLARPPRMELSEEVIELRGRPGEKLETVLAVVSQENRPAVAFGVSDQPWLRVGPTVFRGRSAFLPLSVPSTPHHPGETLQAAVAVTANGGQQFKAAVRLMVAARSEPAPPTQLAVVPSSIRPAAAPPAGAAAKMPPVATRQESQSAASVVFPFLAAAFLVLMLLGVALRDYLGPDKARAAPPPPPDPTPRIEIRFHKAKRADVLEKLWLTDPEPTMRFGLVMLRDGKEIGDGTTLMRLSFDPWGRTNNACLRLDKTDERLFGGGRGTWKQREIDGWKDDQGLDHDGVESVWLCPDKKVQVTQFVELVRGEQSNLLDTCRVRYVIENQDAKEHDAGLRFLLDSYVGGNDDVPFTVPGDADLCDTLKDMNDPKKIPDFIEALEKPDLAHPGTVAHLRLRLEKLEPPSRVTLGAWPNRKLGVLDRKADGPSTLWDVPVLSMRSLGLNDSAIAIYWKDEPLKPGGKREVGYEYGLGRLASQGGKLAATVDGVFRPGGELTIVAYVQAAGENQTLTLSPPPGFEILEGDKTQAVPAAVRDAKGVNRPVTWKVRAGPSGKYEIVVESSAGLTQPLPLEIRDEIFK